MYVCMYVESAAYIADPKFANAPVEVMYVCMYVCVYVCVYVCMIMYVYMYDYVCMYGCIPERGKNRLSCTPCGPVYVCMYVCMSVCICMYVFLVRAGKGFHATYTHIRM